MTDGQILAAGLFLNVLSINIRNIQISQRSVVFLVRTRAVY